MNPALQRIQTMIQNQRPAVMAIGVIEKVNAKDRTATVRYIDDMGHARIAENVPSSIEPGWWGPGYKVGDYVQLHFQGGNPQAPLIVKQVYADFAETRINQWNNDMPLVAPEILD